MDTAALLAFLGLVVAMVAVPGPDCMFMLASGMRHRVVLSPATGVVIGHILLAVGLVLGVGPLVTSTSAILTGLTVVGAGYLLYLGVGVLRTAKSSELQAAMVSEGVRHTQLLKQGIGVAVLNPKALLFYLVIVPQFAKPSAPWPLPLQLAALGGIFIVGCIVVYIPLGYFAGRVVASRPRISQLLTQTAGVIMLALGVGLIAEQIWHLNSL